MPPNRSKSAKPGGLRLPGTFTSPPSAPSPPSPAPPSRSPPRRAATAKASPSNAPAATRRLPGTTSIPASRLARPSPAAGNDTTSGGLLSRFGSDAGTAGSGRLDRAKSTPPQVTNDAGGTSRLERLGLNRASLRQRARSPSPEASPSEEDEDGYRPRNSPRPVPSWGRRSSDDDDGPRPKYSTSTRSFSPAPTSSPPPRHRRSPRPPSPASSSPPLSAIPPVDHEKEEEDKPAEAPKGTLFGNLWTKAATAWSGGTPAEPNAAKDGPTKSPATELKEDPFRKTKRLPERAESPSSPKPHGTNSVPLASRVPRTRSPEPSLEPVEPITYHRPPEIHPRNVLLASTSSKFVHKDGYDWLGDQAKSPLDAYLFHRQASRMATKKVRVKRRPPQGMATALAILAGTALSGAAAPQLGHLQTSTLGSATAAAPNVPSLTRPSVSETSPGVFVPQPSPGPIHAFSQAPRQPPIAPATPVNPPHPGPPPIPPPIPPGYKPSATPTVPPTSLPASAQVVPAAAQSYSQASAPPAPNPNALPKFPAPAPPPVSQSSAAGSSVATAQSQAPSQPPPQPLSQPPRPLPIQSRPFAPAVPLAYSSAPAPTAYPWAATLAPPPGPAPVFTAPPVGPPTSIKTEAPLGDMFKTALAKKMFGQQLSDAPKSMALAPLAGLPVNGVTVGNPVAMQYPPFVVLPQTLVQAPTHLPTQPRLPTPAAPTPDPTLPPPTSSPPPADGSTPTAPLDHGALPPMPIPQSMTPPPLPPMAPSKSISFAPPRPMSGIGGWSLPPPPSTPFPSTSRSPTPSSNADAGCDTPALSPTPIPQGSDATRNPGNTEPEEATEPTEPTEPTEQGEQQERKEVVATPPSSSTPILSTSSVPIGSLRGTPESSKLSFLSLPTFDALTTPLPPSPDPSLLPSSDDAHSHSTSPVSQIGPASPVPALPAVPVSTERDEVLASFTDAKALPPSPSISPALPPLPPSIDLPSVLSPPPPAELPALPPLPPSSPVPTVPPRPFSAASSNAVPSGPPTLSLQRAPSLAISLDSISSPESSRGLGVTSIMLQPPTPVSPIETELEPEPTNNDGSDDMLHDEETATAGPLSIVPLELELPAFDSSPLMFDFDSLDFATPSIAPGLPNTQSYFSSLGLDFGGGSETNGTGEGRGQVERDGEGRLELPVLREENLLAGEEVEYVDDDDGADDMSDQFDAATSFVSGFRETDLARAKVDPGHTGRTEKWLRGQGNSSAIFRPRTAPPSSIPPSSIPPSRSIYARSTRLDLPPVATSSARVFAAALEERDDDAPSPVRTTINFDQPLSSLDRGREVSATYGTGNAAAAVPADLDGDPRRRTARRALSNSAFSGSDSVG
ncbi:hypothetical protein JCM11491_003394 [Sporobolomyces phaffii]